MIDAPPPRQFGTEECVDPPLREKDKLSQTANKRHRLVRSPVSGRAISRVRKSRAKAVLPEPGPDTGLSLDAGPGNRRRSPRSVYGYSSPGTEKSVPRSRTGSQPPIPGATGTPDSKMPDARRSHIEVPYCRQQQAQKVRPEGTLFQTLSRSCGLNISSQHGGSTHQDRYLLFQRLWLPAEWMKQ
ncbi:hypothetical protein BV898_02058 [Hypsibius exemplaris]|uniref:Uncharacterized protein n=1 Tax=Hypsibius exemplaris TaxID=2072580 RepID=A0A1W0X9A2_HYPEX|nr:hypothetical protein BV898_02058 [Hypsibius exemplaris]